jgi:hypothetical protein
MFASKNLMLKFQQSSADIPTAIYARKPDTWARRHRPRLPDAEELVPHATFLLLALTSILQPPASLSGQRGRQLLVETCRHKMARHLSAVILLVRFI